tara:strand:- start:144 stop:401 length:258 start_codon:yes stop_codon:yes gene_type:complete
MKITKRQLKRIIKEEKRKLEEMIGVQGPGSVEGETNSLYIQDLEDGSIQITQLNDNAIIEFPSSEVTKLIDVLMSIHEESRQRNR